MKLNVQKKCCIIKIILTDVDGVLTDGGMYYTSDGDIMKRFHVLDGMGVTLLRKNGIPTIIVTGEKTKIVRRWALKMKVSKVYDGITAKEKIINIISKKFNLESNEMAYIGDDINDIELMKNIGFSATPNNSTEEVKKFANYVCDKKSGEGVFREVADLIISSKRNTKRLYYKL